MIRLYARREPSLASAHIAQPPLTRLRPIGSRSQARPRLVGCRLVSLRETQPVSNKRTRPWLRGTFLRTASPHSACDACYGSKWSDRAASLAQSLHLDPTLKGVTREEAEANAALVENALQLKQVLPQIVAYLEAQVASEDGDEEAERLLKVVKS